MELSDPGAGDFHVTLPDVEASAVERVQMQVGLDFDHDPQSELPGPVQGWSYGICHDSLVLRPVAVTLEGSDTAGLNGGQGPEFFGVSLPADLPAGAQDGITVGVVIDITPPAITSVPAENGWLDARITYDVLSAPDRCRRSSDTFSTQVQVCNTLGSPPVRAVMTVNSESIPVITPDSATITLNCPTLFRRGDSNHDDFIDISDAICILTGLFGGDSGPCITRVPECLDAADTNDDGRADISDAIFMLGTLFGPGPPIPAPRGECGMDPTEDSLGCTAFAACE